MSYSSIVPVTGKEMLTKASDAVASPYSDTEDMAPDEALEKLEVDEIQEYKKEYGNARQAKTKEWTESYKAYNSWMDQTKNPFLSNMFIPKVHEAVEVLAAFLIGDNQSIVATAENTDDNTVVIKAQVSEKWLGYLWRKVLKARMKILIWLKQGIVFGNGIMKVGWDSVNNKPFMTPAAIEDVYFDFFEPDLQDSKFIIHDVRRSKDDVIADEKYDRTDKDGKPLRESVIEGGEPMNENGIRFGAYDKALNDSCNKGKVLLMEVWEKSDNELITLGPTPEGWRILRKVKNPYKYATDKEGGDPFRPFVKLRFKLSPVPNRAYDTGAIYPTVRIQKSFNDLFNEYFDNVVLVNNKMWIKRRGARINPVELVRRPGGIITVSDISKDLKSDETSDVKSSIIEMLNRLDMEFQQASLVVNILKGVPGAKLATEVTTGQQNVETVLDMIDMNIQDALSELGQMILAISFDNMEDEQTVRLFENETETGEMKFKPSDIKGMYDLNIKPDRLAGNSKVIQIKQLGDFITRVQTDQAIQQRYPNLLERLYRRSMEISGISGINYFFEKAPVIPAPALGPGAPGSPALPGTDKLLTPEAVAQSANAVPVAG